MPFYATHVLPRLVDAACGMGRVADERRGISNLVRAACFDVVELDTHYMPGWRPGGYTYRGRAVPILDTR